MLVLTGSGKGKGPVREAPYARGQFLPTHSSASLLKDTGCAQLALVWRQKCEVCSTLKALGDDMVFL